MAKLKRKGEMTGIGCAVQGLGLLVGFAGIFLGPVGWIVGGGLALLLLLVGGRMVLKWVCGDCGNPVADKGVRMCPTCRETFE